MLRCLSQHEVSPSKLCNHGPALQTQEFLWNLIEVCKDGSFCNVAFRQVSLNFYAEHHGKGRCEGAFGLQRRWVADWSRESTISSLEDMRQGIQHGMGQSMCIDPPPLGPSYFVKTFAPPKPQTIKKLDVSGSKFKIEYSYCVMMEKIPGGRVRAKNLIFSDRLDGDTISPLVHLEVKAEEDWRFSYRKEKPEKKPLNTDVLRRRLEYHREVNPLDGVSRRDPYLKQLLQREKRAAKRSAKQKRSKAALAVDLELDSGSSSSSSDTE